MKATKETSVAAVKALCEANAVFDTSSFPPHLVTLAPLVSWLQKAIAAREAALVYFREVKGTELEVL